jgi:hypothetical protein
MVTDDFVLYILVRKDMESFNHCGKIAPQCAHAANHAAESIGHNEFGPTVMAEFSQWQKQTRQGFGTTIVLAGRFGDDKGFTIKDIRKLVDAALKMECAAAIITDPEYPLQDGKTSHKFPCETVGWIFASKQAIGNLLWIYDLHPATPQWSPKKSSLEDRY